ncbi:MAG TPA: sigma-70 family RNA polymerase sigma factor [Planctomycetota bacterium]|nr:sigma-70 family RNA polymerase sigma factor [Planctomycetota bacterium]
MTHAPRFDPDELLQHESFVRELAALLVYAGQAADDVVQDTWVAALQAPARPLHSLRAWLATIVRRTAGRHARSDRRRRQREQRAGHDGPEPVADFAEREQARAAIVRAVLALPAGYRDVVLLRWFEGLPPREVARRLELPVETVRTRNRRALAQLRTALDEHSDGDRAAWTALLLPLVDAGRPANPPANVATATLLGGTLLMSTKLQLTVAAAVALALACWATFPPAPPLAPAKANDASRAGVASSGLPAAVDGRIAATDSLREVVATPVATAAVATTGSAVVSVLWSDRTPAQGVQVMLRGGDVRRTIACDAAGVARFDDLPPALYLANIERGSYRDVEQPRMTVEAGAEATAEIVVAEALDVTGVVVDGNAQPIAAAEIVVSFSGMPNVVVGRTGADGRFAARDVGVDGYVGARAAGLAPSMRRRMTGSVGGSAELRFVLDQPAAALTGTVFGPDGKAVPGARVLVGSSDRFGVRLADGSNGESPAVEIRDTDASGQFSCAPLQPGPQLVRVLADGLAPWWQDITLTAGSTTNLTVHLQAGVTIRGVVRTADGRAVPMVWISAGVAGDEGRSARSTADGSYELTGVTPGVITLRVRGPDDTELQQTVHAIAGQVVRWDPVLLGTTERREQRGRVVDQEGRAVGDARVSAHQYPDDNGYWRAQARTDAEGRFRLTNCEAGVPFYLSVSTGGPIKDIELAVVRPDDEELLVTLPTPGKVRVRGTVLDDRGAPLPNVEMYVIHRDLGTLRDSNRPDGTFDFGPFPAGEYRLMLLSNGFARLWLPFRTLADGETWDAGELHMQRGGNVRATFVGAALSDRTVEVLFPDGSDAGAERTENAHVVIGPFAAGDYVLQLTGDDVVCQTVPIRIRDGIDTTLDVPVVVGTPATFAFTWPASARPPLAVHVTIADGAGTRLRRPVWNRDGTMQLRTMLLPGRYRIEVQADTGLCPKLGRIVEIDVGAAAAKHTIELRPEN